MGWASDLSDRLGSGRGDPRLSWRREARPEQRLPKGSWRIWHLRGGRGSGKTRSGAGGMAEWVLADLDGEGEYGIIAPTYADAWTKCVEGESGVLRALGTSMSEVKDHRSATVRNAWRTYGQVILHNGVIIYVDSAAEGGLRIQGRNLKGAWADEIGLWDKWETAWNESLVYAVRKGRAQIIATGTPKASRRARKLIRSLIRNDPEHGGVVNTRLRTRDNMKNLSELFVRALVGGFRGTRLELQELEGELLDDVANALWSRDLLDSIRSPAVGEEGGPPFLRNVVIGADPSDGTEDSDEQAYTIMGIGHGDDQHIYVAENWGGQEPPAQFARRVIRKAVEWDATIVVEKNHGGAWLKEVFAQALRDMKVSVRVTTVHASQAKRTRAEPLSLLYDRGLVRHCHKVTRKPCDCEDQAHPFHEAADEHMPELEDQMATFTGAQGERSPDRLDSLVWAGEKFLKISFGPAVPGGRREWGLQPELDAIGDGPEDSTKRRRRLAGVHGGAYDRRAGQSLDDWAPREDDNFVRGAEPVISGGEPDRQGGDWSLDGFAPQEDAPVPQRRGRSQNVRGWR